MRRLNESEIYTIYERREQVEKACRACKQYFNTLKLDENTPLTVKQAKSIVAWEMMFLRFETRMTDITAKKEFSAAHFPEGAQEAMKTIADAIVYGRLTLVGPHLDRALSLLQKASGKTKTLKKTSHVYAAEENEESITESTDEFNAGAKYSAHLADKEALKKENSTLVQQSFRKAGDIVRRDLFKETGDYKAQINVNRLIQSMAEIDESVLITARSDVTSKYQIIKNNHEALDMWVEMVKAAYALANKNVDTFLDKVTADKARREKIKYDLMKGFVSLAMSPFMLHFFVDPALQVVTGIASKLGELATELSHTSSPADSSNNAMSTLQRQFFTFLSLVGQDVGTKESKMRKIDEMRKNSPVEYVELMKRFSEYKLNGVAKEMSQAFDHGTHVWGGHSPESIIKAQRMKLLRQEQARCNEAQWKAHEADGFDKLFKNITRDLKTKYKKTSKVIFDEINHQYPKANDMIQLQKIIKHFSFDETSSGLKSINSGNRDALVNAMADEIELGIILKYASIYDPFFGGDSKQVAKNTQLINSMAFDPYEHSHFGLKPDRQGIAILNHLINKLPAKKDLLEPLKHVGWMEYTQEIWHIGTTDKQRSRQLVLNELIQNYANSDIATKLKSTVFRFAAERNIEMRENIHPTVKHEWASEQSLRNHAKGLLSPFIDDANRYSAVTKRQCDLSMRVAIAHDLIESTPSSLDDKTVQEIADLGRSLKL